MAEQRAALSHEELRVLSRFENGLEDLKPYLFNMTDQLIEAYPEKRWNLLVGDDTSARLPTRFVRLVFAQAGVKIPTRYIAASRSVSHYKAPGTYDAYAENMVQGIDEPRGLIISEAAGETLGSIRFTHAVLKPHFKTLDTAIIGARTQPTDDLGEVFCGAIDDEAAMSAVWRTFENPLGSGEEKAWSGALNNLEKNPDPERGDARISSEVAYRSLAAYCYREMNNLAGEYWQNRLQNKG